MNEWRIDLLGSIAFIRRGISYSESTLKDNLEDGYHYINMKSFIKDGGYNKKGLKFYSGFFTKSDLVTEQDLLLANTDVTLDGDIIGVPAFLPNYIQCNAVLFSHHVTRLNLKDQLLPKFLYYLLCIDTYRRWMRKYARGTTVLMLDMDALKRIPIQYPVSKARQKKIATILTSIDTAIEKTEALIEKYQQIKAGLMHDLFTRGVLPNGQLRPPREQAPELYQETAIGWIPRDWVLMKIGIAFEIQLGKMLNQAAKTGKSSFPYIGNKSVQWNKVDVSALEEMDFSLADREKFSLVTDDILVCEGGDVGRTAIWENSIENCYYQKAIHRLRPKGHYVKPRFMLRFMWHAKATGHLDNYTSQSSIAHLTQEKLAAVPMVIPKMDEQAMLIERFEAIDLILEREQALLMNLQQQKLGLMQDLLTGKVPVKIETELLPES